MLNDLFRNPEVQFSLRFKPFLQVYLAFCLVISANFETPSFFEFELVVEAQSPDYRHMCLARAGEN